MTIQEEIDKLEELIDKMSDIAETFEDEQLIEDWTNDLFLLKRQLEDKEYEVRKLNQLIEEEY